MEHETQLAREHGRARLVIVDDHELVRDGLRSMVVREADLEVVGEAANGQEALKLCRRARPDIVLMDMRMPEMDGLEATRAIKQEHPDVSVMMLTIHENADYLFEALKAGAAGYVLKESTRREVIAAIRQVLGGEMPLDPKLTSQLLRKMASEANGHASQRIGVEDLPKRVSGRLTPRELEVLRLLAEGRTNPEIATTMMFSVHTVKVHVRRIISKLGVSDRTQAAVRAIELGLLSASA